MFPYLLIRIRNGCRVDKAFGLNTGRSGVRIPGPDKCVLRPIAVYVRVKYPLYILLNDTIYRLGPN